MASRITIAGQGPDQAGWRASLAGFGRRASALLAALALIGATIVITIFQAINGVPVTL